MVTSIARRVVPAGLVGMVGAATILVLGLLATQPAQAGDPCYQGIAIPGRTEASETDIKVGPCFFGPTVADVPVGATVTFFNGEGFTHLITGANAGWGSRDTELKPGQKVSFTFDTPGVYPYACALHRGMSGAIVVGDASAASRPLTDTTRQAASRESLSGTAPASAGPTIIASTAAGMVAGAAGLWLLARRRELGGRS